jgi:serine/threonine-protein kinase
MAQANADRNLLFGILALQLDFITRDQLVAAMQAWVFDKAQTLGQILCKQGVLKEDTHALIEALVQKHLAQHGNDVEKSLAAVTSATLVREDLKQVADADVQASLIRVPAAKPEAADPYATVNRGESVGASSSSGLRFRILRPHARGGLGEVLVARDEELHREVALKQIQARHAQDRESQVRFLLEAEITGGLEHPGIVPVYGLGQYADGRPFYAMRFIRGDSLKEAIERFHQADRPGRDPGERSLELHGLLGRFVDVCNAIAYAHSRGILHRDLKPGNVMLGKYGETLVVDWGLAKPLVGPAASVTEVEPGEGTLTPTSATQASQTLMGSAMGTPQYMSPEQAAGRLDLLGPASDVYSLGATLYNLLTGQPPVQETDVGEVLRKVQRGDFPPPRQVKPGVPPPLEAICLKAMAREPGQRYASARALADDVEHWLADEPVSAWHEPFTVKARRWLGRHRTLVAGAAGAVLVALVGLAAATVLLTAANDRERAARTLAEEREAQVRKEKDETERQRELVRKEKDETEKQRQKAEHNYQLARKAVDRYHTEVSEDILLQEPGMQPLRKKLLEAAREFYEQFVRERGQDPKLQGDLGKALFRLAQITGDIDKEPEAIKLHLEARKIFTGLAAAEPAVLAWQSDLAECCNELGRLYRRTDQFDRSEDAYKQALALWEPLVAAHAKEDRYRAEQARSRRGLGNVYQEKRRLDEALALYEKAVDAWSSLAQANPKVNEYQRDLAVTQSNLAMAASARGQKERAEAAYSQAIVIQKQLVVDFPNIGKFQNDLARSHFNLGNLYVQSGKSGQAEKPFQEAARLWQDLVGKHPRVTDYQIGLAEAYTVLAGMYSSDGKTAKAEETCNKAIAIKRKLADDQQDVSSYQGDLARGYKQLGDIHRAGGQGPKAETAYGEAERILEKLTRDVPGVPQYQADLARVYHSLGLLHTDLGHREKADETLGKALASWSKLVGAHPGIPEYATGWSTTAYLLGNLARKHSNPDDALAWYAKAINTLKALGPQQRAEANVKTALRNAHWKRAETLAQLGRHADALPDWDVVLELAGKAERPYFQLHHAVAVARAGDYGKATMEAEALAAQASKSGEALYQLACVYALSSAAAAGDLKRAREERQALADQYALRALELLNLARPLGLFKSPANLQRLKMDKDLDAIRPRAEFRSLVEELEQQGKTTGLVQPSQAHGLAGAAVKNAAFRQYWL